MKIGLTLLLLALLASFFSKLAGVRVSAFSLLAGLALGAGFFLLPGAARIVLLIPALLLLVSMAQLWRGRARLRREGAEQVDIAKMKRVN